MSVRLPHFEEFWKHSYMPDKRPRFHVGRSETYQDDACSGKAEQAGHALVSSDEESGNAGDALHDGGCRTDREGNYAKVSREQTKVLVVDYIDDTWTACRSLQQGFTLLEVDGLVFPRSS